MEVAFENGWKYDTRYPQNRQFTVGHQSMTATSETLAGLEARPNIRIRDAFVCLAALLDLKIRKVIGWAISRRIDGELCLMVLQMALERRPPMVGCVHHSDRRVRYARAVARTQSAN
jgi:transposase InsO family protein